MSVEIALIVLKNGLAFREVELDTYFFRSNGLLNMNPGLILTRTIALLSDHSIYDSNKKYTSVTGDGGRLRGILRIRDLLFRDPSRLVKDVMIKVIRCVSDLTALDTLERQRPDYVKSPGTKTPSPLCATSNPSWLNL